MLMRLPLLILLCYISSGVLCQDSLFLKAHFLYGSRPKHQYRQVENKWFGGILGGHVGVEGDSNQILNFTPHGSFHVFTSKHNRHSHYILSSVNGFYSGMGGQPDSMKKTIVYIPITPQQKRLFDSISVAYLKQTPYDYAFIGMRCGAAAYDILAQLGIVKQYGHKKTYWKIFYPRKLRKRLLKKARLQGWKIEQQQGTIQRRWEKD